MMVEKLKKLKENQERFLKRADHLYEVMDVENCSTIGIFSDLPYDNFKEEVERYLLNLDKENLISKRTYVIIEELVEDELSGFFYSTSHTNPNTVFIEMRHKTEVKINPNNGILSWNKEKDFFAIVDIFTNTEKIQRLVSSINYMIPIDIKKTNERLSQIENYVSNLNEFGGDKYPIDYVWYFRGSKIKYAPLNHDYGVFYKTKLNTGVVVK